MNWQTLAPELIFQILSKFLPGLTLHVTEPRYFPWYLGHICSSWRAVFKSSPQFWSSLVIHIWYAHHNTNIERAMLLIEMGIQRSKNHPLTFQFKTDEKNKFQLSHCHKLLEALMAQSTRWLNAYFYLPSSMVSLLYSVKTRLPILRAFRLMITSYDNHEEDSSFSDLFEDAPQVKHTCIVDYTAWNLNWSSITTLHLHFADMVESELLGNFLQRMEHLEELYLESRGCTSYMPSRVTLPFLRCLGTSAMENLVLFEMPALEELYIKPSDLTAEEYYEVVRELVGPLNHLKKLVLFLTDIDMAVLIFQYLPAVQNIDFYVQDLSVLKILPLCPSARHLETMTVGLALFYEAYHLREVLDLFGFWSTQCSATTGFGRFEGLKQFTLMLNKVEKGPRVPHVRKDLSRIESEIIGLFEERGVQCNIKRTWWQKDYSNVAVPPPKISKGQVADYLL